MPQACSILFEILHNLQNKRQVIMSHVLMVAKQSARTWCLCRRRQQNESNSVSTVFININQIISVSTGTRCWWHNHKKQAYITTKRLFVSNLRQLYLLTKKKNFHQGIFQQALVLLSNSIVPFTRYLRTITQRSIQEPHFNNASATAIPHHISHDWVNGGKAKDITNKQPLCAKQKHKIQICCKSKKWCSHWPPVLLTKLLESQDPSRIKEGAKKNSEENVPRHTWRTSCSSQQLPSRTSQSHACQCLPACRSSAQWWWTCRSRHAQSRQCSNVSSLYPWLLAFLVCTQDSNPQPPCKFWPPSIRIITPSQFQYVSHQQLSVGSGNTTDARNAFWDSS